MLRRSLLLLLIICSLLAVSPPLRSQSGDLRQRIMLLLTAYHPQFSAQDWQQLGEDAPLVMMAMVDELVEVRSWQLRLLDGLKYFAQKEVIAFLEGIADGTGDSLLRRQAVSSLVFMRGSEEIPRLQRLLSQASSQNDWRLRARILQELVDLGDESGLRLVTQHLRQESSAIVRSRTQRLLQQRFRRFGSSPR